MIDLKPACTATASLVAGVDDDRLDDSTPCADHAVRDLIAHLDQVARGADAPEPLGPDWRTAIPARLDALAAEWAGPAAWEGVGPLDLPNAVWGRIVLTEMVVHGWDLARATAQPFDLDDGPTLRACLDHVAEFVPNAPVPQLWGAARRRRRRGSADRPDRRDHRPDPVATGSGLLGPYRADPIRA